MIFVVMGVTGSGKSSVGRALAARLDGRFLDGDDYHLPTSRAKLAQNIPLGDEDRWPWLRILADLLTKEAADGKTVVLACSALKQSYRDILASNGHPTIFVHLVGEANRIARRLDARAGTHELVRDFDKILAGQYRDLEPPTDAVEVNVELPVDAIVDAVVVAMQRR